MSRSKFFFYNSLSSAAMQVIIMISGFIVPRIMLEYYGSEINGLVSSIMQFIGYFRLVEAGLSGAAIYALYTPLANKDYALVNSIIVAAKEFYHKSGYIFIGLVLILALIFPFIVDTEILSSTSISILVIVLGFSGIFEFLTLAKYRVFLTADQKTYIVSISTIAHIVVSTVIIVALAKLHTNIVLLKAVALLSIVFRILILYTYTKMRYKYLDFKAKPDYSSLSKRWYALYLQILGTVQLGAPVIILTIFLKDLKIVSVYVIFNMVMSGINNLLGVFISGLAASFGNVIAKGQIDILKKSFREFEYFYYFLLSLFYAVTFVTIMPFIRIYTHGITDISYDLPLLGFLFVLNGLFYNLKTPEGMLVISAGLFKETSIQTTIQGLIIVIFGVILVNIYGIYGVLIASILSNVYRVIDLLIFIPRKLTKTSIKKSVYRILNTFLIIFIVYSLFSYLAISTESIIDWIRLVIIVSLVCLSLLFLHGYLFEKVEIINLINRFKIIFNFNK